MVFGICHRRIKRITYRVIYSGGYLWWRFFELWEYLVQRELYRRQS
jgi:hypothetical protein